MELRISYEKENLLYSTVWLACRIGDGAFVPRRPAADGHFSAPRGKTGIFQFSQFICRVLYGDFACARHCAFESVLCGADAWLDRLFYEPLRRHFEYALYVPAAATAKTAVVCRHRHCRGGLPQPRSVGSGGGIGRQPFGARLCACAVAVRARGRNAYGICVSRGISRTEKNPKYK